MLFRAGETEPNKDFTLKGKLWGSGLEISHFPSMLTCC